MGKAQIGKQRAFTSIQSWLNAADEDTSIREGVMYDDDGTDFDEQPLIQAFNPQPTIHNPLHLHPDEESPGGEGHLGDPNRGVRIKKTGAGGSIPLIRIVDVPNVIIEGLRLDMNINFGSPVVGAVGIIASAGDEGDCDGIKIHKNIISVTTAGTGGGVNRDFINLSDPAYRVENLEISNNLIYVTAGQVFASVRAINIESNNGIIQHVQIYHNTIDCAIASNAVDDGIRLSQTSPGKLFDVDVINNIVSGTGSNDFIVAAGSPTGTRVYNMSEDATATADAWVTDPSVDGSLASQLRTNIYANPGSDWRHKSGGVAIDAGYPGLENIIDDDIANDRRPEPPGSEPDMGCYESQEGSSSSSAASSSSSLSSASSSSSLSSASSSSSLSSASSSSSLSSASSSSSLSSASSSSSLSSASSSSSLSSASSSSSLSSASSSSSTSAGSSSSSSSATPPENEVEGGGLRLGQIFDVNGEYTPIKASAYLKRVGSNANNYFDLDTAVSLDATNFRVIKEKTHKLIFYDRTPGLTGKGTLKVERIGLSTIDSDHSYANYPIKTSTPNDFQIYLRSKLVVGAILNISVMIDDIKVDTLVSTMALDWVWINGSFTLPDTNIHNLGIRLEDDDAILDKIYISSTPVSLSGTGPALTTSPYITVHTQVYNTDGTATPTTPLLIYDYKNSIDDINKDDWYNFDINPIDSSISIDFVDTYALVLSSTGGSIDNYIIWELVDNDEYLILPSVVRI